MAISASLYITDGSTSIDFNGANSTGTGAIIDYVPMAIQRGETEVTENASIRFIDTSASAVMNTIRSLESIFTNAGYYTDTAGLVGVQALAKFRPASTETLMQAVIKYGELEYDKPALDWQIKNAKFRCNLTITRGAWQAASETAVPLTNRNASNSTSPLAVENADDSSYDNWVAISASDVAGVTFAPLRFQISSCTASGSISTIYMGLGAYQNFTTLPSVFEGESATNGVSACASASCSSGSYGLNSGSIGTGDSIAFRWALTASQANAHAGKIYHVVAKFALPPAASMFAAPVVTLTNGTAALHPFANVALATTSCAQYLGAVQIPPTIPGGSMVNTYDLVLMAHATGGAASMALDYLKCFPSDGGFCTYRALTSGLVNGDVLIDDGSEQVNGLYQTTSASLRTYNWKREGDRLRIVPGRTQRLYMLTVKTDNTAQIDNNLRVQIFYRPTRSTL